MILPREELIGFSDEDAEKIFDMENDELEKSIKESIDYARLTEDKDYLEYVLYSVHRNRNRLDMKNFVSYYNQLILETWHYRHEDIALFLEFNGDDESVENLYKAIFTKYEYLEWDDNYALAVKCVWGIAKIHGTNSRKYLEILSENENEIISQRAKKRLREYE